MGNIVAILATGPSKRFNEWSLAVIGSTVGAAMLLKWHAGSSGWTWEGLLRKPVHFGFERFIRGAIKTSGLTIIAFILIVALPVGDLPSKANLMDLGIFVFLLFGNVSFLIFLLLGDVVLAAPNKPKTGDRLGTWLSGSSQYHGKKRPPES